jgi:hypothetical protein
MNVGASTEGAVLRVDDDLVVRSEDQPDERRVRQVHGALVDLDPTGRAAYERSVRGHLTTDARARAHRPLGAHRRRGSASDAS